MKPRGSINRLTRLFALLTALALVAAACGSDSSAVDDNANDEVVAPAQSDDEEAAEDEAMEDEAMDDSSTVTVTIENIADFAISDSAAFSVPDSGTEPGPALPGDAYSFSVSAAPGQRLSFATMFVQTNDWFFAPNPEGIELYDESGEPISGDVTDQVFTFDSGTEIDQAVGEGADQAPRQAGPNTGADDEEGVVREVDRNAANYVSVSITPSGDGSFDVRIENVSEMASAPTPLAPGVFAVHNADTTLFELGVADAGYGLEALAEDGNPAELADFLAPLTGISTPLAPGVFSTHGADAALFVLGSSDAGLGLEALSEDGDPSALGEALGELDTIAHSGVFNTPGGASEPGPALLGGVYSFEVPLTEGNRLSFATMFVQSNDWVFATPAEGLDLASLDGDISDQLLLIDTGTEIDQLLGFGPDQAPRQAGPNTGAADDDSSVRIVEGRSAARYIRVTVTPS